MWSPQHCFYFTPVKNKPLNSWSCLTMSLQRQPGPTDGFVAKAQACSTRCYFWLPTEFFLTLANLPASLLCFAFPSFLLHEVQSNLPSWNRTGKFPSFKVLWNHMETVEHIKTISMPGSCFSVWLITFQGSAGWSSGLSLPLPDVSILAVLSVR